MNARNNLDCSSLAGRSYKGTKLSQEGSPWEGAYLPSNFRLGCKSSLEGEGYNLFARSVSDKEKSFMRITPGMLVFDDS